MPRKVITSHVHPPIPTRAFDWCAFYDGQEERGYYGWGATEADAMTDLTDNGPDDYDADEPDYDPAERDPDEERERRRDDGDIADQLGKLAEIQVMVYMREACLQAKAEIERLRIELAAERER